MQTRRRRGLTHRWVTESLMAWACKKTQTRAKLILAGPNEQFGGQRKMARQRVQNGVSWLKICLHGQEATAGSNNVRGPMSITSHCFSSGAALLGVLSPDGSPLSTIPTDSSYIKVMWSSCNQRADQRRHKMSSWWTQNWWLNHWMLVWSLNARVDPIESCLISAFRMLTAQYIESKSTLRFTKTTLDAPTLLNLRLRIENSNALNLRW